MYSTQNLRKDWVNLTFMRVFKPTFILYLNTLHLYCLCIHQYQRQQLIFVIIVQFICSDLILKEFGHVGMCINKT